MKSEESTFRGVYPSISEPNLPKIDDMVDDNSKIISD